MMSSLASLVVRRRRAVITLWIVLLLAAGTVGSAAFDVLSSSFGAGPGTESGRVTERLDELAETGGEIAIIADGVDVDDPATITALTDGLQRVAAIDGVVAVVDPWSTGVDALRATDGRAALAVVTITGGLDEEAEVELAHEITEVARDLDAPEILVGGNVLVGEQFATASENDLLRGEAIALPIAFVAMIFLLGGLRAGALPFLVAIAGVITSLAVLVAATAVGDVSIFSINVVNMLGIGLGIDYGLLMINRFREERGLGHDVHDAVVRTVTTAGTTVVFSALTVAVAMGGLFVFGVPILSSFGIAGLGVVLLCMSAAITLLPATLAAVGGKIPPSAPVADVEGRFYRLTRWVQSHAVAVGAAAVVVLVLLGVPFLNARFEIGDARTLPRSSEVRDVALTLADRFPARGTDPVTVIADIAPDDADFAAWLEEAEAMSGVAGIAVRPDTPAGVTVVDITPTGTSQGPEASALVAQLRDTEPSLRHRGRRDRGGAHRRAGPAPRTPSLRRPPGRHRHPRPAVPHDRLGDGPHQGGHHEHPQPGGQLRRPRLGVPGRAPVRSARVRLGRRAGPLDADPHPHLRLRPVDGLRGVPPVPDQGGARRDRRQRPGRRRRPPAKRPHHHRRRDPHRDRVHRLRRRRGPGHQAARRRSRHRGARRRHHRPDAPGARDDEAPRRAQLVGAGSAAPVPPALRAPRSTLGGPRHRADRGIRPHRRRAGTRRRARRRRLWDHGPMTPSDPVAPALDELTITVVVDNATDTLSSIAPGVPQLPEMAYLLGGLPPMGQHDGHDCVVTLDHLCVACHGFSALAEARVGDQTATVLFDVGPYGDVWVANAERLSVDLARIDVLFLSHWHWDHSGGIPTVVEAIADARSRAGRPPLIVDVHPDRPDQRGILTPLDVFAMLPPEPTIDAIEAAGGQVVEHADAHLVAGLLLSSGDIPRGTTYETGLAGHYTWRDGEVALDLEIHDERFLAANVRGRGTTVFTACSHAGVVNVGLEARQLIPDQPIDLLLGGYHLAGGAVEDRIEPTVRDLAAKVEPRIVAPGHCTGWRAASALAEAFAPSGYAPSVVGTRYVLVAA